MKREVIVTADGSKTIYIQEMDENYHSNHGALQEANHVFIQNGLQYINNQQAISVFEMGFGTGLNALLTLVEAEKNKKKINYVGIEAFPVEIELIKKIGYEQLIEPKFQALFSEMHTAKWNEKTDLTPYFSFEKIHQKIENHEVLEAQFDLVYYDAFGPRAQETMWIPEILGKMYRMLKPGGVLVTYCAKGQVKRDLKALGFNIEALSGPPGKREMTRAHKF